MSELRSRVQQITENLNALLRELSSTDEARARELVESVLTTELMLDFKASVDSMRHLIWIYIEALARVQDQEPATVIHSIRLQNATDMLRALHGQSVPASLSGSPATFFERVQQLVDDSALTDPKGKDRAA